MKKLQATRRFAAYLNYVYDTLTECNSPYTFNWIDEETINVLDNEYNGLHTLTIKIEEVNVNNINRRFAAFFKYDGGDKVIEFTIDENDNIE